MNSAMIRKEYWMKGESEWVREKERAEERGRKKKNKKREDKRWEDRGWKKGKRRKRIKRAKNKISKRKRWTPWKLILTAMHLFSAVKLLCKPLLIQCKSLIAIVPKVS